MLSGVTHYKFFKYKDWALGLINEGKLHFHNPSLFENDKSFEEQNYSFSVANGIIHERNYGVSCFTENLNCYNDNQLWEELVHSEQGVLLGFHIDRSGDLINEPYRTFLEFGERIFIAPVIYVPYTEKINKNYRGLEPDEIIVGPKASITRKGFNWNLCYH